MNSTYICTLYVDGMWFVGVKVVSFNDWKKIDQEEVLRGHRVGKSREKITSVNEFLQIASS